MFLVVLFVVGNMALHSLPQLWLTFHLSFHVIAKINILPLKGATLLTAHESAIGARISGFAGIFTRATYPGAFSLLRMCQTMVLSPRIFFCFNLSTPMSNNTCVCWCPAPAMSPFASFLIFCSTPESKTFVKLRNQVGCSSLGNRIGAPHQ